MGWTYGHEVSRGEKGTRGGRDEAVRIWCESKTHIIGIDSARASAGATMV